MVFSSWVSMRPREARMDFWLAAHEQGRLKSMKPIRASCRPSQAFNTSLFERASAAQLSQNYRTFPQMFNNLRSDVANNVDLSLLKNIHVTEKVFAQFRFEAFHALTWMQFAAPNLTPTSAA